MIARTPEEFREAGLDVRINTRAAGADLRQRTVSLSDGTTLPYDFLVLATGSIPRLPDIPGIEREGVFTLKNYTDALRIKAYLQNRPCRKAAIVGAGFIAMEMAESFQSRGLETTVVYRGSLPARRWDREFGKLLLQELNRQSVTFLAEQEPVAIEEGVNNRLRLITNQEELDVDLVLFSLGVRPNVQLAADMGVKLGNSGAIKVNFSQATDSEGVYAAGDCSEVFHRICKRYTNMPLGDLANKQGRVVGRNIGGDAASFPGVVGAQSFKLFNLEVAATGIDEQEATSCGYHPVSTVIWGKAIPGMMPAAKQVGIKLVADSTTGKLLGAQALGEMGAVSRINVLSCALWGGMDLDDLSHLDLAYAPPFSSAWDVIHIAAQNLRKKL